MINLDVVKCPGCPEPMGTDAIERLQKIMLSQVRCRHADCYEIYFSFDLSEFTAFDFLFCLFVVPFLFICIFVACHV